MMEKFPKDIEFIIDKDFPISEGFLESYPEEKILPQEEDIQCPTELISPENYENFSKLIAQNQPGPSLFILNPIGINGTFEAISKVLDDYPELKNEGTIYLLAPAHDLNKDIYKAMLWLGNLKPELLKDPWLFYQAANLLSYEDSAEHILRIIAPDTKPTKGGRRKEYDEKTLNNFILPTLSRFQEPEYIDKIDIILPDGTIHQHDSRKAPVLSNNLLLKDILSDNPKIIREISTNYPSRQNKLKGMPYLTLEHKQNWSNELPFVEELEKSYPNLRQRIIFIPIYLGDREDFQPTGLDHQSSLHPLSDISRAWEVFSSVIGISLERAMKFQKRYADIMGYMGEWFNLFSHDNYLIDIPTEMPIELIAMSMGLNMTSDLKKSSEGNLAPLLQFIVNTFKNGDFNIKEVVSSEELKLYYAAEIVYWNKLLKLKNEKGLNDPNPNTFSDEMHVTALDLAYNALERLQHDRMLHAQVFSNLNKSQSLTIVGSLPKERVMNRIPPAKVSEIYDLLIQGLQ